MWTRISKANSRRHHFILQLKKVNRQWITIKIVLLIGDFFKCSGHEKIVRTLIRFRAKVNAENNIKSTPLHYAAKKGKLFLHLHPFILFIGQKCKYTSYSLCGAIIEIVSKITQSGFTSIKITKVIPLCERNYCALSSTKYLCASSNSQCVWNRFIVKTLGIGESNAWSSSNSLIIFPGHVDVVRALIGLGAEVNAETISKVTPLHFAAFYGKWYGVYQFSYLIYFQYTSGHEEVVCALIELGSKVNAEDDLKRTPLHLASLAGK